MKPSFRKRDIMVALNKDLNRTNNGDILIETGNVFSFKALMKF